MKKIRVGHHVIHFDQVWRLRSWRPETTNMMCPFTKYLLITAIFVAFCKERCESSHGTFFFHFAPVNHLQHKDF